MQRNQANANTMYRQHKHNKRGSFHDEVTFGVAGAANRHKRRQRRQRWQAPERQRREWQRFQRTPQPRCARRECRRRAIWNPRLERARLRSNRMRSDATARLHSKSTNCAWQQRKGRELRRNRRAMMNSCGLQRLTRGRHDISAPRSKV